MLNLIGFGVGVDPSSYLSFQSDKTAPPLDGNRVGIYLLDLFESSQEGNYCIDCLGYCKEMVEFVEVTSIFFESDDWFLAVVYVFDLFFELAQFKIIFIFILFNEFVPFLLFLN